MAASTYRQTIQDFMRDVRAQTGVNGSKNTYTASLNPDNVTVQIFKNQVQLYAKVLWPGTGSAAVTDLGGANQDTVDIFDGQGFYVSGSASAFIASLT
jgi:hypothetical protein